MGVSGMNKANDTLMSANKGDAVPMRRIAEIQPALLRNQLAIAVSQMHEDRGKSHSSTRWASFI